MPPELEPVEATHLEALEVHWTSDTDFNVVASVLDQGQLRELSVMVYRHLGQRFLYDMFLLIARAPSNLTRIEIVSLGDTTALATNARLIDNFKPLLDRHGLQYVTLVLTGYRFDFSPLDLDLLARAWPALRYLNLSFSLLDYTALPNLAYTIPTLYSLCPRLEFLHVPAVATASSHGVFRVPVLPDCAIQHVSSDVAWFEHATIDIAWSLQRALPRLQQVGGLFEDRDGWYDADALVRALKVRDYATIFEHLAKSIRAGDYGRLP